MSHILVVDDEQLLLDLIANTLRLEGHEVVALSDSLDALRLQTIAHRPFDLLLTDIHSKPISGFELVKRLASEGITMPVLFMSGYPAMNGVIASGLGDRALLEKPFTAQQLRAAVKKALQRKSAAVPHEA